VDVCIAFSDAENFDQAIYILTDANIKYGVAKKVLEILSACL
jgi:hypothetical protein